MPQPQLTVHDTPKPAGLRRSAALRKNIVPGVSLHSAAAEPTWLDLELHIVPDTSGGDVRASLAELRIA